MVLDFAKDHGVTDAIELHSISERLQLGDMSPVLEAYESEIKKPLRNVILGDLIRSLFIQLQKAKVDGELAMSALDKLLRSNELNFAFLTVLPSVAMTGLLVSYVRSVFKERLHRGRKSTRKELLLSVR